MCLDGTTFSSDFDKKRSLHIEQNISFGYEADAKVAQVIFGHANISMAPGIYGHGLTFMQKDTMDAMDDLFGE
jgi:hypothetical protein